mmetsp:Transcript_4379/g.7764  ORF Transcript_4379/g.7764 Transcript_4379/m.7764 type:complete len:256 (-) Transcript_4379:655-1422(-)
MIDEESHLRWWLHKPVDFLLLFKFRRITSLEQFAYSIFPTDVGTTFGGTYRHASFGVVDVSRDTKSPLPCAACLLFLCEALLDPAEALLDQVLHLLCLLHVVICEGFHAIKLGLLVSIEQLCGSKLFLENGNSSFGKLLLSDDNNPFFIENLTEFCRLIQRSLLLLPENSEIASFLCFEFISFCLQLLSLPHQFLDLGGFIFLCLFSCKQLSATRQTKTCREVVHHGCDLRVREVPWKLFGLISGTQAMGRRVHL